MELSRATAVNEEKKKSIKNQIKKDEAEKRGNRERRKKIY